GYRLADAEGPGRPDASYYDLLASEARLASFVAIAKGDVPETHWFHLGRSVTTVHGAPVLLSWSATLFEYLMPLVLMRTYPDTLLDTSCRIRPRSEEHTSELQSTPRSTLFPYTTLFRSVLLSWSATLFEYLMPLVLMRTYPDTLLDTSCRIRP